jgi:Reverse transcriptase (RNA-dependent DNA polymerase)
MFKRHSTHTHKRLITKLATFGITDRLFNWIKSFLSERKQRVKMERYSSACLDVLSEVHQGRVLGPYFYNLC